MTPTAYLKNIEAHLICTCYYSAGTISIKHEGKDYTYKEFFEAFPIHPVAIRVDNYMKGENPDKTKSWMVI